MKSSKLIISLLLSVFCIFTNYVFASKSNLISSNILSRDFNLYYANLHCHSKYSPIDMYTTIPPIWDSLIGHPREVYAYARDSANIDILAITDHTHRTTPFLGGTYYVSSYWDSTRIAAIASTIPGSFLALAGFEWTSWFSGHINVMFTDDFLFSDANDNTDTIYQWLSQRPFAVAQFNHPEVSDFNSFRYQSNIDTSIALFEMQNTDEANRYHIALDSGWYVGMTANQDNHVFKTHGGIKWGDGNQLTGIWADSLTSNSIYSALRQMRTYGTLDRNFFLKFTANNYWMGSKIPNGNIQLSIIARDPDTTDLINRIDIITNHGAILDSLTNINSNNAVWQKDIVTGSNDNKYFYVRVIENDGNYIVSSAIWTRRELGIKESSIALVQPKHFALENNYPNPFKTQTAIRYSLTVKEKVILQIYDISGKTVRNLVDEYKGPGVYTANWNGRDDKGQKVSEGIYFCRFEAGDFVSTKKMLIIK